MKPFNPFKGKDRPLSNTWHWFARAALYDGWEWKGRKSFHLKSFRMWLNPLVWNGFLYEPFLSKKSMELDFLMLYIPAWQLRLFVQLFDRLMEQPGRLVALSINSLLILKPPRKIWAPSICGRCILMMILIETYLILIIRQPQIKFSVLRNDAQHEPNIKFILYCGAVIKMEWIWSEREKSFESIQIYLRS